MHCQIALPSKYNALICSAYVTENGKSIIESADQKAQYMGLQTFREKNLLPEGTK